MNDAHAPAGDLSRPDLSHSTESEQAVLGGLLLDNTAWNAVAHVVTVADFYVACHRTIFQQIADLIEDDRAADVLMVAAALEASGKLADVGGQGYLGALAANIPGVANIRRYAETVRERALRREARGIALELADGMLTPGADVEKLLRETPARFEALPSLRARSHALDWDELAQDDPEPPGFIVPGWMPEGDATLLAGHGGVGKSAIALHLAVCIALGLEWAGLKCARRRVLYYCCEDNKRRLAWRLRRICLNLGLSERDLKGRLEVDVMAGKDTVLWERDPRTAETLTPAYHALVARMRQCGARVLMLDGISDTFGGNENSRGEVKRYSNAGLALIPPGGALLMVGHVNRQTAAGGATSEGYSGNTQWHNAVRGRWYLYPETEDDEDTRATPSGRLVLALQKIQDSAKGNATIGWRWDEQAHMFLPEAAPTTFDQKHEEREELHGIRLALKGCMDAKVYVPTSDRGERSCYLTLSQRSEFPPSLKGGSRQKKRRFYARIENLRQMRHIREEGFRRENRHKVEIWTLTSEGCAACVRY